MADSNITSFPNLTNAGAGRKRGARNRQDRSALAVVRSYGPAALAALHEAVAQKQKWATIYILDRILPLNSRAVEFEDFTADDITEALRNGDLSADEGVKFSNALGKIKELTEIQELKIKLAEIERIVGNGK